MWQQPVCTVVVALLQGRYILLKKVEYALSLKAVSNIISLISSKQRLTNNYCPTILDIKGDDVEDAKEASENEDLEDEEEGEEEDELLQDTDPGPLGCDGKDVEDVLNIISQSIYREGEGIFFIQLSSFLSVAII